MANQLNNCLCALVNALTASSRNSFIAMLQTIKTLLVVAKAQAELYNVDWANQSKLYGFQFALQAYQLYAQPYVTPIQGIKGMLMPFIDCDVNQTIMRLLNMVEKELNAPVNELNQQIMALQNEIDMQDRRIQWFDDNIRLIEDFIETIQNGCVAP